MLHGNSEAPEEPEDINEDERVRYDGRRRVQEGRTNLLAVLESSDPPVRHIERFGSLIARTVELAGADACQLTRTLQYASPRRRQGVTLSVALHPIGQLDQAGHAQLVQVGIEVVAPYAVGLSVAGGIPGSRCRSGTLLQNRFQRIRHGSSWREWKLLFYDYTRFCGGSQSSLAAYGLAFSGPR